MQIRVFLNHVISVLGVGGLNIVGAPTLEGITQHMRMRAISNYVHLIPDLRLNGVDPYSDFLGYSVV
jgi:hypothetical protein